MGECGMVRVGSGRQRTSASIVRPLAASRGTAGTERRRTHRRVRRLLVSRVRYETTSAQNAANIDAYAAAKNSPIPQHTTTITISAMT